MDTEHICPSCRKPLPAGAPQGLCPACLMKAGFGSGVAPEPGQPSRTPPFVPPPVPDVAKLFPQFEIMELLGQGGMGAVYKARQPALDRLVALKILPPETGADSGFADRFTREARALARLSHPNIVAVHEFGEAGGLHYFVMEYVEGLNLRQLQQAGRLAPREALKIIPQICDALQFAHDEGIVHRDIKPENVMLDKKGRVKITDFGLAKLLGREPTAMRLTGAKDVMGTPHYMAPEQIEHPQEVDHRADIYSLGVVFYEMLTGELPLGRFAPPSRKVQVDVRLDEVVLHALEKEPERRYQQASQVKSDVETIAAAAPRLSMPVQDAPRPAHPPVLGAKEPDAPRFTVESVRQQFLVLAIAWWIGYPVSIVSEFVRWLDVITVPALITATVFWCILLYRHWALLQGHGARTTPGKAVGYGFIPIFWFYWWFVAYAGLATDNNRFLRQIGITSRRMSFGLAVTSCILGCLLCTVGWFPVGWAILIVPYMIIGFVLVVQQRDCVLAMLEARTLAAQPQGETAEHQTSHPHAGQRPADWTGAPSSGAGMDQSLLTSAATRQEPRFSRTAIVGACWSVFGILAALFWLIALTEGGPGQRPTRLGFLLFVTLVPLGVTSVLGTTILGGIAISRIRHSQGRLSGLGLAVFDVLLFPLLALNGGLIIGWCWLADQVAPEWMPQLGRGWFSVLMVGLMVTSCAVASWLMTRAVWRSANRTPGGGRTGSAAVAPRAGRAWGTVAAVAGVTLLFAVLAGMFSLAFYHYSKKQAVTTYDGKNAFAVQQKLLREVVRHLEAANYRWERLTVAIHYFVNPDVAECKIEGLRKLVNKELPDGSAAQQVDALSGGLDIRHTGDGVWAVRGSGGLAKVQLLVDAKAEMGPIRWQMPLFTRLLGHREPAGPPPATSPPQDAGKSRAASRSQFPKAAHIGGGNYSVMIHHDDVDLHYALFFAGEFSSDTQGSGNSRSQAWTDDGSLKLKSGRTFGYLRESPRPDRLRINGKEYNLRQGRVFTLSDDGAVAQMALFPPLEVARDPQRLAGVLASSGTPAPFGQARPGQFKVSLTNGLEFEVLAVASSPRSSSVWWRPDGTLLPEAPGDRLGAFSTLCPDRKAGTEFALLTRRAGEFVPETELLLGFEPRPNYVTATDLYKGGQAKGRVTLIGFRDVVPGSLICKIGLADGAWERVATWDQTGVLLKNESGSTLQLIRSGADDQTCLKLNHNLDPRKFALRLAARLKSGEHKTARLCRVEYAGLQNVHTCSLIQNLQDSEVVAYELYRLPLRWVRVPGIATRPAVPLIQGDAASSNSSGGASHLEDLSKADQARAVALFNDIEDFGHEFSAAFDAKNLAAAETGTRRLLNLLSNFNAVVKGTGYEFPPGIFDDIGKVRTALRGGDWEKVQQAARGNDAYRREFKRIATRMVELARQQRQGATGEPAPELLAELVFAEVPPAFELTPSNMTRSRLLQQTNVEVLSAPRIQTPSGTEAQVRIATQPVTPDRQRPQYGVAPAGMTARLLPEVDADQVRFTLKVTLTTMEAGAKDGTLASEQAATQEFAVSGRVPFGSPMVFELGSATDGRRRVGSIVFTRVRSASAPAVGFGPVVERVIAGKGDTNKRFIDLDKGRLFAASEYFGPKAEPSPEETQKWLTETGIDAVGDTRPLYGGLVGFNLVAAPVLNEEWDKLPPSKLDYYLAMSTPGTPVVMSGKGALPATYAVKTREGARGLLQIVGISTNVPSEVNIRYKLVQPTAMAGNAPDGAVEAARTNLAAYLAPSGFAPADVLVPTKDDYAQREVIELLPDGRTHFLTTVEEVNHSEVPWETYRFVCSDFVNVTNITDARYRPIRFETTRESGLLHFFLTLNEPVPPGRRLSVTTEGTATGQIRPTGAPGVFEYAMRHWPMADRRTRRIELHRLPPGARLLDKEPGDLQERTRDGRVELFINRLIPTGDSLEIIYHYRLDAPPATNVHSSP